MGWAQWKHTGMYPDPQQLMAIDPRFIEDINTLNQIMEHKDPNAPSPDQNASNVMKFNA